MSRDSRNECSKRYERHNWRSGFDQDYINWYRRLAAQRLKEKVEANMKREFLGVKGDTVLTGNEECIVNTSNDGKRVVYGKFWLVQNDTVNPSYKDDKFGRPTLEWPGKSIFGSYEEALACARAMTKKFERPFFVMQAVTMVEVKKVSYKETAL